MARPRLNPAFHSWNKDKEPDWKSLSKADAIREASKLLGGERSAIQVIRYLENRSVRITSPQAVKVLGKLYKELSSQPNDSDDLAVSVRAVLAVQKYIAEHGSVDALVEKLEEVDAMLSFANGIGGLEVMRVIAQQLRAPSSSSTSE